MRGQEDHQKKTLAIFAFRRLNLDLGSDLMWTYLNPDRIRHIVESCVVDRMN